MKKIYVVVGSTGEYSDRSEWLVVAFRNEQDAKDLVEKASARAREIQVKRPSEYYVEKGVNEFDPTMQMDYTGTSYYYAMVELKGKSK